MKLTDRAFHGLFVTKILNLKAKYKQKFGLLLTFKRTKCFYSFFNNFWCVTKTDSVNSMDLRKIKSFELGNKLTNVRFLQIEP